MFNSIFGKENDGLVGSSNRVLDSRPNWFTKAGTYTGSDGVSVNLTAPEFNAIKSSGVTDGLDAGGLSSLISNPNEALSGIGGFEGLGKGVGLGLNVMGIMNQRKGAKLAKQAWEAENARANEIMAMNREKYDTFKKDKAALNASYSGAK